MYSTVGLHIDREDDSDCSMYECVGNLFSGNIAPGGLAPYDLCACKLKKFLSVLSVMQGDFQFIIDVVTVDSEVAYVSDYY